MKCSHRIRVSSAGFEIDLGSTGTAACDPQTQKLADWRGKSFWRHIRALFDDVRCSELGFRFRRVRLSSQIATDLAVCEWGYVIFNEVIQFSTAESVYIQEWGHKTFASFRKGPFQSTSLCAPTRVKRF
jgi:hypothetical protein